MLNIKARQYDRVKVLMEATQQTEPDSFVQSPSKQKQLGSDIADPKEGEKECGKCNKKFKSTGSYQKCGRKRANGKRKCV